MTPPLTFLSYRSFREQLSLKLQRISPSQRWVAVLFFLGCLTHLWRLTSPSQVVFDETHMGKFVSAYAGKGERFFDIHPPHGKLVIAAFSRIGGYHGDFPFEKIGDNYGDQPLFWFRIASALSGIAIPMLFFYLLLALGASIPAAFLGGFALVFENALLLETRLLLFDGILIASLLASLLAFLSAEKVTGEKAKALLILSGIMAGLAVGSKVTGLAIFGIIGVYSLTKIWGRKSWEECRRRTIEMCLIVVPAIIIYLLGWWIHFSLLVRPGSGDKFYRLSGFFIRDLYTAHYHLFAANLNLISNHPDGSPPWSWPLMKVVPYYWKGEGIAIYLIGNPVVWWGSIFLLIQCLTIGILKKITSLEIRTEKTQARMLWLPLCAYFICYLPLFKVKRVLFLYHYLSALIFSLAFVVLWFDQAGWITSNRLSSQRRSYYFVIGMIFLGFCAVMPLTYGLSWGTYDDWLINFIRSWR